MRKEDRQTPSIGEFRRVVSFTSGVLIFACSVGIAHTQGFFFFAPPQPPPPYPYDFYDPYYYEPNPYQNYHVHPQEHRQGDLRKKTRRKVVNQPKSSKHQRRAVAFAVTPPVRTISCDKAQTIIAEYGFKEIVPQSCSGKTRDFRAMRDGKTFEVRVLASDGELEKVQKLR